MHLHFWRSMKTTRRHTKSCPLPSLNSQLSILSPAPCLYIIFNTKTQQNLIDVVQLIHFLSYYIHKCQPFWTPIGIYVFIPVCCTCLPDYYVQKLAFDAAAAALFVLLHSPSPSHLCTALLALFSPGRHSLELARHWRAWFHSSLFFFPSHSPAHVLLSCSMARFSQFHH